MVSWLVRSRSLGSSPAKGHVFCSLARQFTLSQHPGGQMGTGDFNAGG